MVELLYMIDHPDSTVSNFMGKSTLVHKGLMPVFLFYFFLIACFILSFLRDLMFKF